MLFHSYHSYFFTHSQLFSFLCLSSLFSLFPLLLCFQYFLRSLLIVSHCARLRPFYNAYRDKIYHFYPSTTFGLLWVSFPDCPLVCWLPSHHYYPVWATPCFIPRQKLFCFVFLLLLAFSSE